jgi:hypothetical protein
MEDLIKEVVKIISEYELDVPNRRREIVNKKYYLYNLLKEKGCRIVDIAKMFKMNHSSVINGINQYKLLLSINDEILNTDTKILLKMNLESYEIQGEHKSCDIQEQIQYYSLRFELVKLKKIVDNIHKKFNQDLYKELK